jgi:hypothetical protein
MPASGVDVTNRPADPGLRHRLATGQYGSESRVPDHGAEGLTHLEHGGEMPTGSVTLTATSAHPENGTYQGAGGKAPTVTVAVVDAAANAVEPGFGGPGDFRASPAGALGLSGAEYHGEHQPAPNSPGHAPFTTPGRPGGPAGPDYRREPGVFQHPATDGKPPGWQYSTPTIGEGFTRTGFPPDNAVRS